MEIYQRHIALRRFPANILLNLFNMNSFCGNRKIMSIDPRSILWRNSLANLFYGVKYPLDSAKTVQLH